MFTCNDSGCPSLIYQALLMIVIAGAVIPTAVLFINALCGKEFLGTWKKQPKLFVVLKLEEGPQEQSEYKKAA